MKRSLDEITHKHTETWYIFRWSQMTHVVPSLPRVHIHLLFSDRERHLWSPKYIKFLCVCMYFQPEISSFFPIFSYLLCYLYFGTFLSTWLQSASLRHVSPILDGILSCSWLLVNMLFSGGSFTNFLMRSLSLGISEFRIL